ncbi:GDP-mannose 4,6-dehydratase [Methanotrichaceae archaeon M04Ac]|uniref:GDP-mannose 4,6-dehydratase n=1 Tax=Candidatus Methanocrinis alkalitolerans TaxID=3033395 RepID=A0ABT5XGB6_9EURY|nr:NAD-dependent epimerase/dehydratase family protein [Candidatus Methanocrinis alkalitolerans]MDF0593754.1 GDP-mannose 4,6-dehydratase [Candidatus Methanocrinis alkalitolerans]
MSVLVTGGAGFIGSNLTEELLASGEDVIVLDNLTTGSLENLEGLSGNLKVVEAGCPELTKLDINPRAIYHLGVPSSSPIYKSDPLLVGEAINGMIAVLELAKKTGARVVYASTSSLYSGQTPPHREDMEVFVTDYYTEARLSMERMAELYRKLFGVEAVGMRFFSVYGPHETAKKQYANIVTQFLWEMMAGRAPVIYGDGTQTRDFTYVKDITRALRLAMESEFSGALNVGTGKSYSFNEAAEILAGDLGLDLKAEHVDNPIKNYVQDTLADTRKAEEVLGFKAEYTLREGIREIIKYYGASG